MFALPQRSVGVKLPYQRLSRAGIEDVDDAALQELVEADGVVAAVVENFDDGGVDHDVAQHFLGEPKGLELAQLVHVPNVEEEGVATVVELHHFDEASSSQSSLEVNSQHSACQDVRCAFSKSLEVVNVVALALGQWLSVFE